MSKRDRRIPYDLSPSVEGTVVLGESTNLPAFNTASFRQKGSEEEGDNLVMFRLDGSPEQILFFAKALDISIQTYNQKNTQLNDVLDNLNSLVGRE